MKIALLYHSIVSDWNHGNAHFLRGIAAELAARGHHLTILEPADGWSRQNLVADAGPEAVADYAARFPALPATLYQGPSDLERHLEGADLVLVHEWNDPRVVAAAGRIRRDHSGMRILFHDTHHRAVTAPDQMQQYDLSEYDGALVYGAALRDVYERRNWARAVYVWHEAADVRLFQPVSGRQSHEDLVWVGNWGDEERSAELRQFLLTPARRLQLSGSVYGVRYPEAALRELGESGLRYRGWIANFCVPEVFAASRVTIHVPRRPYVELLPGIPTIRVFEALACGIPLVCAPWSDVEGLFRPGSDFLIARSSEEMCAGLREVLASEPLRRSLAANGLATIRSRHTCAHRVEELLAIERQLRPTHAPPTVSEARQ